MFLKERLGILTETVGSGGEKMTDLGNLGAPKLPGEVLRKRA